MHGGTLHGLQLTDKTQEFLPSTYYVPGSGVGRSMLYEYGFEKKKGVRVGVIGLGTGSLAAYCRPGDTFNFYEIDERIEKIARTYFSYLSHCAGASVHIGDARLVLDRELRKGKPGQYDIIAVDAFTDDSIPVHLLTTEAMGLYESHLRSDQSIIAVHISNRYLNVAPVILSDAVARKLSAKVVLDNGSSGAAGEASIWVLLTKDPNVFDDIAFSGSTFAPPQLGSAWTDEYASLLPILTIPLPWN